MKESSKIKVLHFTQVSGGIATYLEHIFRYIDQRRFELILVCPLERESLVVLAKQYNITLIPLNLKWNISPIHDLINLVKLVKIVSLTKPHIIHSHSSKAGMLSRMARPFLNAKVVYTPNAYAYLGKPKFTRNVFFLLEKMAIPFTDVLLASSKSEMKRSLEELKFSKSKVLLYPNSVEALAVNASDDLSHDGIKVITTVGRFVMQKNPLMFLKVCKKILENRKDVIFQIIGSGYDDQLLPEAKEFISQNHLEPYIRILSWMDRQTLLAKISQTDVFVMTSIFESFGYVAAEAQMLNIPVVATNVDGLNEIVENDVTGYLVAPEDVATMATKVLYLLENPNVCKEMGNKGRNRMEKIFNVKENINLLESVYDQIAG